MCGRGSLPVLATALHIGGCLAFPLLLFIALTGSAALVPLMETEQCVSLRALSLLCSEGLPASCSIQHLAQSLAASF